MLDEMQRSLRLAAVEEERLNTELSVVCLDVCLSDCVAVVSSRPTLYKDDLWLCLLCVVCMCG